MASKSKIAAAKRPPKFSTRLVRRCMLCGRPDLLPQAGRPGLYSGREKGELVNPAIEKRALLT
jgi:hypothetical protein